MPDDRIAPDGTQVREDLRNLLRFTEQLLATRDRVVFDIADYPVRLTERDLRSDDGALLPGIALEPTEDVWLSFARLQEQPPPRPDARLMPWLRQEARPTPARPPTLLAERVLLVTSEEATDLVEAGFATTDAIAPVPGTREEAEQWAVPIRPAALPQVVEALASYTAGPWQAWAVEEAPRREAVKLYEALYKAYAQMAAADGEGGQELVIGLGLARWQRNGQRVNVPLIEQRAEFELNESDGTLALLPRNVPPAPALRPFAELGIDAASRLQRDLTRQLEERAKDAERPFGPSCPASFHDLLTICAAHLDASGTILAPGEELGPPGERLRISPSVCVLVRPRRDDILRDDIRRLEDVLSQDAAPLPEVARRFVVAPPDVLPDDSTPFDLDRLIGSASGTTQGDWSDALSDGRREKPREWLFFPLPANEEQEEIARRLEREDAHGVVVQGPPGTGKTHTIANIIGHSMARGHRVLVSAHTAEALSAIREKLPSALRDLAIAVTHSDREGARQLEHAVSALAARVQSLDPREAGQRAQDLLRAISQADLRLAEIDAALADVARANLTEVPWRGDSALPQAIAAWTAAQGQRHAWFPDRLDLTPQHEPRFGDAEINEVRALRLRLGEDVRYRASDLPSGSAALPSLGSLVAAHRVLRDVAERRERERDGSLPRPDLSGAKPDDLAEMVAWLERLAGWRDECSDHDWMLAAWEALALRRPLRRIDADGLGRMLEEAARLAERGETLALDALELPEVPEADRLGQALDNLAAGQRPFGFFDGLRRTPVKDAVEAARVAAEPPRDAASWAKLAALHRWRRDTRGFVARWNALAAQHDLTPLPREHPAMADALGRLGGSACEMLALLREVRVRTERLGTLFPYGLDANRVVLRIEVSVAIEALRANLGSAAVAEAERLRQELRGAADQIGAAIGEALRQVAEGLGTPGVDDAEVAAHWRDIQAEADRLAGLRDDRRRLSALATLIRDSGAEKWAVQIEQPAEGADDPALPPNWRDAWDYASAVGFLARVADRAAVQALTNERAELTLSREQRFREAIELLTYLGLRKRLTEAVQAALRQFLAALAKLPKTAGAKTAVRQRRILRDSLERAVKAIPCWIMPEWRVAEQLPPELGGFDLVIIDEASQSNILALPVVLRGRKVLIVGDDRQVSPVAVGIQDAAIGRLRNTYLRDQPLAQQIDPATSLYELGGMMYPGKVVVLREHFRCVEPIIRFSSRFYDGQLVPLRLPKPSERLDPPLIDILVEDGRRRGDVNEREAEVVVEEIKRAIGDPELNSHSKRSIGVISLHADKQARRIYERLIEVIGPARMSDHRIMCGDAATFQGQERDIMFLSMVHDKETATKQSSRLFEQRYNVALSRARDRMVLVRSVTPSMLKKGDIKLEVLRHFQDPMAGGRIGQSDDVLAACDSGFERDVGARLLRSGYRLRAQVPVGGYRIDFVVEGTDDRRLAVELDGDAFHGPDRWAHDIKRQKALERVGWTFWRCWASEWEADREATFRDLVATLERHGIMPIGVASDGNPVPVAFRSVRRTADAREALAPTPLDGAAPLLPGVVRRAASVRADVAIKTVQVGDAVVLRYADGRAGSLTVRIVEDGSADGRTRVTPTSPLGEAILGSRIEDEAEVEIEGKPRTVIVQEIQEAT